MRIDKTYLYTSYFLILALCVLGILRIRKDLLGGISFITQGVIMYGFLEIIQKGMKDEEGVK